LSNALLERGIERRIGVEAHRECNIQYSVALAIGLGQQLLGVFDPEVVQVIEETHTESGINNLRQMIDRTTNLSGEFWQSQIRLQKNLPGVHNGGQSALVLVQLSFVQSRLGILMVAICPRCGTGDFRGLFLTRDIVVVGNHHGALAAKGDEISAENYLASFAIADRLHSVLIGHGNLTLQDLANLFVAMSGDRKKLLEADDKFVMCALSILRNIDVSSIGCKVVRDRFRVAVIPTNFVARTKTPEKLPF